MRILITGNRGQLGSALQRRLAGEADVIALDRAELDITDARQVEQTIEAIHPDLTINAAAYTDVDGAETDQQRAQLVNADGPRHLAEAATRFDSSLIHISTDYVFDGRKGTAYLPDDVPNPLSVYGQTKLAGERAITQLDIHALIIRTSWLYGPVGRNFLNTMRRLIEAGSPVRVVNDQHGCPTSVLVLAEWIAQLVHPFLLQQRSGQRRPQIVHLACSGDATWYDFAHAIFEHHGVQDRLTPIASSQYPTAAKRPVDSRLSVGSSLAMFQLQSVHWRDALQHVLENTAAHP